MSGAIAIFVKTPGLTPSKTRLGKTIGQQKAEQFYLLCLDCAKETLGKFCAQAEVTPFWAVAEAEGMESSRWSQFATVFQGEGGLGERLHEVYSQLIAKFDFVIFVGADSPQLTAEDITQCLRVSKKQESPFVMGETDDGGFYFFLGRKPIAKEIWTSVEYSSNQTAIQLKRKLGEVALVPQTFDVDTEEDLGKLQSYFMDKSPCTLTQGKLQQWLAENT